MVSRSRCVQCTRQCLLGIFCGLLSVFLPVFIFVFVHLRVHRSVVLLIAGLFLGGEKKMPTSAKGQG